MVVFTAIFDNMVIIEWEAPQTWRHVFTDFKLAGIGEGHGILYCNGHPIRETGKPVN